MVDGDHSPEGVRRDLEDLLDSRAVARPIILIHDVANERVRQGVDAVRFAAWPKVAHVELDWIPGQLFAEPALRNELWYGLGLVIVDSSRLAYLNGSVYEQRYHPAAPLLAQVRELVVARERVRRATPARRMQPTLLRQRLAELESARGGPHATTRSSSAAARRARARRSCRRSASTLRTGSRAPSGRSTNITGSASWRMTEPLRSAKRHAARRARADARSPDALRVALVIP